MGINIQQNNYFESLFRRTTASYRGKIDKDKATRNQTRHKSSDREIPTTSKQAAAAGTQRVLQEINHSEGDSKTSSTHYIPYGSLGPYTIQQTPRAKVKENGKKDALKINAFIDYGSIKTIIEQTLTQVLQENCLQKNSKDRCNEKEKGLTSPKSIKSVVEETLNQIQESKVSDLQKDYSDPGSFKSIIEDIIAQVLKSKLSDLTQTSTASRDVDNLNQDLQNKLNLSKEKNYGNQLEHNKSGSLDTQSLVQELLGEEVSNKNNKSKKHPPSDKENSSTSNVTCYKRLRRSPRKKPEWQNLERSDGGFEKPSSTSNQRSSRPRSPTASSSVRSGRSRYSSSVMSKFFCTILKKTFDLLNIFFLVPRSASQGRSHKPNSDPVALYQYYKKEWEHFRQQIPGETMHHRLRWNVRQRMLDPE